MGPFPFTPLVWSSRAERSVAEGSAVPSVAEMAVDMYRAIPRSALWVVPNGGHGRIFFDAAPQFVQTALSFFRTQDATSSP